jgi:hypothetical protein
VDTIQRKILTSWSISLDSPITSVRLFSKKAVTKRPDPQSRLQSLYRDEDEDEVEETVFSEKVRKLINKDENGKKTISKAVHLLVTSALEPAVIYLDVRQTGFSQAVELPESSLYDCVLGSGESHDPADNLKEMIVPIGN